MLCSSRTSAILTRTFLEVLDVEEVPAVLGDQAVDQRDPGTRLHQAPSEVGADEPQPAGDQDALVWTRSILRCLLYPIDSFSVPTPVSSTGLTTRSAKLNR